MHNFVYVLYVCVCVWQLICSGCGHGRLVDDGILIEVAFMTPPYNGARSKQLIAAGPNFKYSIPVELVVVSISPRCIHSNSPNPGGLGLGTARNSEMFVSGS